jgi:hypothetical protein
MASAQIIHAAGPVAQGGTWGLLRIFNLAPGYDGGPGWRAGLPAGSQVPVLSLRAVIDVLLSARRDLITQTRSTAP